ncbi:Uncharacterized protein BP5553_02083 [Venustampulla echinocandica]|uniref:DUF3824 domain-containing protein n=1 Tax=Venustampulla echinocandica TaxID=2656787 RepID=A0A370U2U3_9HELO|nr:Uncharacterized protein BP5553_02083 [Venustampulla echinocandica]RDL42104.1 Uncharacterized protein BP5553_02083 [Venustampulla echinocandica]
MSGDYDYDRYDDPRRHRSHRHRDDREPRYVDTQETYVRGSPYVSQHTDIIRRPTREDSDLSIEEVRRDFPPPGADPYLRRSMVQDNRYGPPVRSRSAERGYGPYLDERRGHKSAMYVDEEREIKPRRRSLSRNQKILAAVGGAAIAVGTKEVWDRKQADGRPVTRNPLSSAAVGAAGAFAAYEGAEFYAKHSNKEKEHIKTHVSRRGRDGELKEYYSSDEETVEPKKSRRKSLVEDALGFVGLGAAAKALTGKDGKSHSRRGSGDSHLSTKSRRSTRSRSHGRGKSPEGAARFQQAAKAALLAGATEAFRVRKEPGGWDGAKGKRILTAAIGAGGIDAAADKDPDKHSKRHILEAVVGGLAGNRLINGSRKDVQDDDRSTRSGRSRSRSKGPGGSGQGAGLAALATAGLGALAGKKLMDRSRSRSRGSRSRSRAGDRRRRHSPDSYDSRSPSPRRGDQKDRHKRSKSVTDYARKGLAALGIGEVAKSASRDRGDRDVREIDETHVSHRSRRHGSDDDYEPRRSRHGHSSRDDDYASSRGEPYGDPRYADSRSNYGTSRDDDDRRSSTKKKDSKNRRVAEGKESAYDSSSDLGSSGDDEKRARKMKGKQFLTAGLATVATIHAAHNVYQSMEKRDARRKAVAEGEMSPEEARKLKAKATLQDAASIGIAALGIKGAISELKEVNHIRNECKEFGQKKEERHQRRLERQRAINGGTRSRSNGYAPVQNSFRDDYGPRYIDDNPYSAALPAPPVGYDRR